MEQDTLSIVVSPFSHSRFRIVCVQDRPYPFAASSAFVRDGTTSNKSPTTP